MSIQTFLQNLGSHIEANSQRGLRAKRTSVLEYIYKTGWKQGVLHDILHMRRKLEKMKSIPDTWEMEDKPYYWKDKFEPFPSPPVVVTGVSSLLPESLIDGLIEDQTWMLPQVQVIMKAVIVSYLKLPQELLPISVNIALSLKRSNSFNPVSQGAAFMAGTGPLVLKLLQQLGNFVNTDRMVAGINISSLLETVFEHVPPMSTEEQRLVYSRLPTDVKAGKRLGSASLSETFLRQGHPKEALKFLRPYFGFFFLCEWDFVRRTAWPAIRRVAEEHGRKHGWPRTQVEMLTRQAREVLLFFMESFAEEFDFETEVRFTAIADRVYKKHGVVSVIRTIRWGDEVTPFSVTTLAPGKSMREVKTCEQALAVMPYFLQFYRLWVRSACFTHEGYFHADPHGGNLFFAPGEGLTVIDMGSSGFFGISMSKYLLRASYLVTRIDKQKKTYEQNLSLAKRAARAIGRLCGVHFADATTDMIVESKWKMYEEGVGELLVACLTYNPDLGRCTRGSLVLFGRAMAYLTGLESDLTRKAGLSYKDNFATFVAEESKRLVNGFTTLKVLTG